MRGLKDVDGRSFLLPLPVGERGGVTGFGPIDKLYALTRRTLCADLSPRER